MAYWREIKGLKYLYGTVEGKKDTLIKPLYYMSATEATKEAKSWDVNSGHDKTNWSRRSVLSVYEDYLRFLRDEEYSPKTIRTVEQSVRPFAASVPTLRDLTSDAIKAWNEKLIRWKFKRGQHSAEYTLSKETRLHRLRQISAFLGWMEKQGIIKKSPYELTREEGRKDAGRALTAQEVVDLFDHWTNTFQNDEYRKKGELAKLFFYIIFYGGTRLTETLGDANFPEDYPGAYYEDLDRHRGILNLRNTKDDDSREVALPRTIVDMIPTGTGPIFREKITEGSLRHFISRAIKNAGITGRVRIHDGRVTSVSLWAIVNPSPSPKAMMDQYGWKTPYMAIRYTKIATEERVNQAQNIDYHARLKTMKVTAKVTADTPESRSTKVNNESLESNDSSDSLNKNTLINRKKTRSQTV